MTPRRNVVPLTRQNATGNGVPSTEDLIQTQNAILRSNAAVLGAVSEFRKGMDQRLDRQFGEVNRQLGATNDKLDGVCKQVGDIEEARRLSEALAKQAANSAVAANAVAVQHSLSTNQRWAIVISAIAAVGGVAIGFLNFVTSR
jgi:hypothetical protein